MHLIKYRLYRKEQLEYLELFYFYHRKRSEISNGPDGKENVVVESKSNHVNGAVTDIDLDSMKPYEAVSMALNMLNSNAEDWYVYHTLLLFICFRCLHREVNRSKKSRALLLEKIPKKIS